MTSSDPKSIAMMIMAKKKPDGSDNPDKDSGDDVSPLEAAAKEVMDAINAGDPKQLAESLKAFCGMCDEDENSEE